MADLNNTVAIVTGGASGIGYALAQSYGRRGAQVLIADIDKEALQRACLTLSQEGVKAVSAVTDLRNIESIRQMLQKAKGLGPIRAVCMNAGVTTTGPTTWETASEAFDFIIDVNLRGLFNSIKALIPTLIEQDLPADIIVTASMAGMVSSAKSGAYSASKAGAIALAKALRAELLTSAPKLRVALLNPGMVQTNLLRTSAAHQPQKGGMDSSFVEGVHDALNQFGVTPNEVVSWVTQSIEAGRFWVFPPPEDIFSTTLNNEIFEMKEALER